MKLLLTVFPVIIAAASSLRGQQIEIGEPVSSLVYDLSSRTLRPLRGTPGTAYLGASVTGLVDAAAPSPDGRLALYLADGVWRLLAPAGEVALPDALPGADSAVWAPDSSAAVLRAPGGRIQRLALSGGDPILHTPLDFSGLGESVSVLAVGKNAGRIALAAAGSDGVTVYLVQNNSSAPLLLTTMTGPAAAVFVSETLFLADKTAGRIVEFRGSESLLLADERNGVSAPVALAASGDGKQLFCALEERRVVQSYDLAARVLSSETAVDVAPERLAPLTRHTAIVLADRARAEDPLWILDISAAPVSYFVPAGQPGQ